MGQFLIKIQRHLRKDPGEEPLDVVVDEAVRTKFQREKSSERQTEGLQNQKFGG